MTTLQPVPLSAQRGKHSHSHSHSGLNSSSAVSPSHYSHSHPHPHSHSPSPTSGSFPTSTSPQGGNSTNNPTMGGGSSSQQQQQPQQQGTVPKFRASMDATKQLSIGVGNGFGGGGGGGGGGSVGPALASPGLGRGRPSSEMLNSLAAANAQGGIGGGQGGVGTGGVGTAESEAIDKWFEDLQNYEATLEEMAAASLDQNFKEELTAIEQWFKVLSEAERTAALYSLLMQNPTQVQIRFFLTVLGQMARADPMSALLSPANPQQASMEAQMEAKLAQMGLKSPVPPSPAVRQFARQSLGAGGLAPSGSNDHLSPAAANPSQQGNQDGQQADPAALLAQQRARLNKAQSHRISAPSLLAGAAGGSGMSPPDPPKSPVNWQQDGNTGGNRTPSPEPRSSGSGNNNTLTAPSMMGPNGLLSPQVALSRPGGHGDSLQDQLSPIVGGNWASMVNTPLVPMFNSQGGMGPNPDMGQVNMKLNDQSMGNNWGSNGGNNQNQLNHNHQQQQQQQQGGQNNGPGFNLGDARKFRRDQKPGGGGGNGNNQANGPGGNNFNNGGGGTSGGTSQGMNASAQLGMGGALGGMFNAGMKNNNNNLQPQPSPVPSGLLSPQAAALQAQNNWRNGLLSPGAMSGAGSDDSSMAAFNNMNMMNNGNISPSQAMMNLMAAQQQVQQLQMQAMAMGNMGNMNMMGQISPNRMGGMGGMGGMPGMMGMGQQQQQQQRRSPRNDGRSGGQKSQVAGSGANPEENIDLKLLNDIPAWLRSLRLHKYTPNFENANWKDMVQMDDAALDAKGVAALGARRKMLKVFETVRIKMGMQAPGEDNLSLNAAGAGADGDDKSRSVSPAAHTTTSDQGQE